MKNFKKEKEEINKMISSIWSRSIWNRDNISEDTMKSIEAYLDSHKSCLESICTNLEDEEKRENKEKEFVFPDKLSELLGIALDDIQRYKHNNNYVIDMGSFHESRSGKWSAPNPRVCKICLCGSILAGIINDPKIDLAEWLSGSTNNEVFQRLKSIDCIRRVDIVSAVRRFYDHSNDELANATLNVKLVNFFASMPYLTKDYEDFNNFDDSIDYYTGIKVQLNNAGL